MRVPCPLCRRPVSRAFTVPDSTGSSVALGHCNQCHVFATLYPRTDSLLADQVAFHEELWAGAEPKMLKQERLELGTMVDHLKAFLPDEGGTVLDVGCGRGALVAALRDKGYAATGLDASERLVETARSAFNLDEEIVVAADAFAHLADAESKYAAIFLWHVIEHVDDPMKLLLLCRDRLSQGGRLLIQVPALHPAWVYREHLMLVTPFTARAIARLAECHLDWAAYDPSFAFVTIVLRLGGDASSTGDLDAIDARTPELAALQGFYLTAVGTSPRAVEGSR